MGELSVKKVERSTTEPSEKLKTKGRKAAKRFLEMRGYEILSEDFEFVDKIDFVCLDVDEDTYVFVELKVLDHADSFESDKISSTRRRSIERLMLNWVELHANDVKERKIRFDTLQLNIMLENYCMVKHSIGLL